MRIIDTATLDPELRQQAIDWVTSLGIKPANVLPTIGLHGQQLYLTEKVRTDKGGDQVDLLTEQLVTRPLIVQLDPEHQPPEALVEAAKTMPSVAVW